MKTQYCLLALVFVLLLNSVIGEVFKAGLYIEDQDSNVYTQWNTTDRGANIQDPDSQQDTYLFMDEFPGPLINVTKGDNLQVLLNNKLQIALISVYWHGIQMLNTPWMGTSYVNQCPLQPEGVGSYFYNFTANRAGTYWYHNEASQQYMKGAYGPLIVADPNDPFRGQYNGEQVWFINDFMRTPEQSYATFVSNLEQNETGVILTDTDGGRKLKQAGAPRAVPIGGQNTSVDTDKNQASGTPNAGTPSTQNAGTPQASTAENEEDPPEIDIGYINAKWGNGTAEYPYPQFNVTAGQCFRLRLIAPTGGTSGVRMYIAYHSMKIIAKNSVNVNPVDVSGVVLYSTERLDAIICPNRTQGAYKINMVSQDAFLWGSDLIGVDEKTGDVECVDKEDTNCWSAVMLSTGRDFSDNVTISTMVRPNVKIMETAPLPNLPFYDPTDPNSPRLTMLPGGDNPGPDQFPARASETISLYAGQLDNDAYYLWDEEVPYGNPTVPLYISRLACGLRDNTHIIRASVGEVNDIVINNILNESSPIHFHGNRFWNLAQGSLLTNQTGTCNGNQFPVANAPDSIGESQNFNDSGCVDNTVLNTRDPLYSDTVVLGPNQYAYLRVRFDNPGPWALQGYTQTHQEQGMTVIFAVGRPETWPRAPGKITMCGEAQCLSQVSNAQAPASFDTSYDVSSLGLLGQMAGSDANMSLYSQLVIYIIGAIIFMVFMQ